MYAVRVSVLDCPRITGMMNEFHAPIAVRMLAATMPGRSIGSSTWRNSWSLFAPSRVAASSTSSGTARRNASISQVANGTCSPACTRMTVIHWSYSPRALAMRYSGMRSAMTGTTWTSTRTVTNRRTRGDVHPRQPVGGEDRDDHDEHGRARGDDDRRGGRAQELGRAEQLGVVLDRRDEHERVRHGAERVHLPLEGAQHDPEQRKGREEAGEGEEGLPGDALRALADLHTLVSLR